MSAAVGALVGVLTLASSAAIHAAVVAGRRSVVSRRLAQAGPAHAGLARLAALAPDAPAVVARRLAAAGLEAEAGRIWAAWMGGSGVAVVAAAAAGGVGLALVVAVTAVAGPAAALAAGSGRGGLLVEEALPEALEAVARSLRSGSSLRQAVEEAAAATPGVLGDDLRGVAGAVAAGQTLVAALDAWGFRRPLPGVRLAVSALGLGAETGGAHARAVDGVAATVRNRLAVGREVRALSSQARLSALVIVLAPLGFSALAAATDEGTAEFLLRTPFGLACLAAGLLLDGLAALWMHRLSRLEP